MRVLKYLSLVLLCQSLFFNAAFAETLMQDGVVVSYELGEEEAGKFSIEIQNDTRHAVEVILNAYAMVTGRALGSIYCNENFLKSYELQAGRILRVIEPGCEPKRFRTLESYVKIVGVKPLDEPEELVSETEVAVSPVEETPSSLMEDSVAEKQEETPTIVEAAPVGMPLPAEVTEPEANVEEVPIATILEEEQVSETPTQEVQEVAGPEMEVGAEGEPVETMQVLKTPESVPETKPEVAAPDEALAAAGVDPIETFKEFRKAEETDTSDETPIELEMISELMPDAKEGSEAAEEKVPDPIVRETQEALLELGYEPGPVDGLMGRRTEAAIRAFQEAELLPVDGLPSAALLLELAEQQDQISQERKITPTEPEPGFTEIPADDSLVYGILSDGPRDSDFLDALHQEFIRIFGGDFELEAKLLVGDWTRAAIAKNLDQLLADPEVDIVLAMDLIASHEASHRDHLPKPVFAPFVLDREMQQLPLEGSSSGVKNLNYLLSIPKIRDGVEMFHRMASFDKMAVVVSRYYYDAFPEMQDYINEGRAFTREGEELLLTPVFAEDSVDDLLEQIPADIEAVYLIPILHFTDEQNQQLFDALNQRGLLTFSHLGHDDVEQGVLATIAPKNDTQRLARRLALNVQRSLEGEDPGDFSVYFLKEGEEQLVINMETARKIDFYPTFATQVDAVLLHEEPEDVGRQLTLQAAIDEALEANLELLSKQQEVKAGQENISIANALHLPQIDLSLSGSMIDEDRASGMAFGASEQVFSGSAGLSQLIYSDTANANVTIQKNLQQNLEDQLEQTRLDITLLAGTAYLNVLRGKTLLNIQKDNLKVTNSNLDVARTRVSVGMAGKGELYRWEAEQASSRQDVLEAENALKQAEFNLNRILHRAQEELFATEESEMSDPFLLDDNPLIANLDNSRDFKRFRNFAVEIGLRDAPELAQIDSAIKAQTRLISSIRREYTLPSVGLQGNLTGIFAKGGEGADGIDTEGLPPALADAFSSPEDLGWSVGVGVSLPIFSGGGKRAEHRQAKLELERLLTDRAVIAEQLEQRIRSYIYQTGNSYSKIRYARDAAEAAQKTLNLVTKSYQEGLSSILDVIDAQNTSLIAEELVADNVYNFLLDLMNSQRATNRFDFLLSAEERKGVWDEFNAYMDAQ